MRRPHPRCRYSNERVAAKIRSRLTVDTTALFAVQLDILGRDAGVRAFSLHPGAIITPLQRHLPREEMIAAGWIDENGNVVNPDFKTPEQGAATQVWAATSPQLTGLGGAYLEDCDLAEPTDSDEGWSGVRDYAIDPEQATRLWQLSAELTGVDAFAGTGQQGRG